MNAGSVPKYAAIAADLRERYQSLPAGTRLPNEKELAEEFGVSRMTVRQALQLLAEQMQVVRIRGRGTFVQDLVVAKDQALTSFTEDMVARGVSPVTRLVALEEMDIPEDLAAELLAPPRTRVVRVERLRFAGDEPICHETVHIPLTLASSLSARAYETSLHDALRSIGRGPVSATRRTAAVAISAAVARLFGLPQGSPALRVRHTFQDGNGSPLYRADSHYRADRYEIVTQVRRRDHPC